MKNLLFAVLALITMSLNAQITIPSKVLTPAMVNTNIDSLKGSVNKNLTRNDKWTRAKAQVEVGQTDNLSGGLKLVTLIQAFDVAFEKKHSRQGISDVKFIAYRGQQFLQDTVTAETRYLHCLNVCSTFEPTKTIVVETKVVDTVTIGGNIYITNNHNYFSNSTARSINTQPSNPDLNQNEGAIIGNNKNSQVINDCDYAEDEWDLIEDAYDDKNINRREAKTLFNELFRLYPGCLSDKDYSKVWRNDGEHLISGGAGFVLGVLAERLLFNARDRKNQQQEIVDAPIERWGPNDSGSNSGSGNQNNNGNESGNENWGGRSQVRKNSNSSSSRSRVVSSTRQSSNVGNPRVSNRKQSSVANRNIVQNSGNRNKAVSTTRSLGNYSRGTRSSRSTNTSSSRTSKSTRVTRTQTQSRARSVRPSSRSTRATSVRTKSSSGRGRRG